MRILSLIIRGIYFDEIINGTKKYEYRDIRPNTYKKYYQFNTTGQLISLRHYDAIQLYVGYNKNRKAAMVEVTGAKVFEVFNEYTGKPALNVYKGVSYEEKVVEYALGAILDTNF